MNITRRILLQIAAAAGFVILVVTGVTYRLVYGAAERQGLNHLSDYVAERARLEEAGFLRIQENLELARGQFLRRIAEPQPADLEEQWTKWFEKYRDGAWRSRREFSDGRKWSTLWLHKAAALTPERRNQILRANTLCNDLLPAWVDSFQSLYFVFPWQANIGFDPRIPNWVWETAADYDNNAIDAVASANPKNNPSRQIVWNGVLEEPTSHLPYIAVMLPVDVEGRNIATVGHDIHALQLVDDSTRTSIPEVTHFIFHPDGRLLAHPGKMPEILASNGRLTMQDSGDPALRRLYEAALKNEARRFAGFDEASGNYYAVSRLAGPEWYFITTMPQAHLQKQAYQGAQWVLWSGLVSLALVLVFLAVILKRRIAQPLADLARATSQMSAGDMTARATAKRSDELSQLAGAFNEMVAKVEARSTALRESEQRWRAFVEQAPLSIQIFGADGHTLLVNRAFEEFWGVPLAAMASYNILRDEQLEANGVAPQVRRAFAGEVVAVPAARYDASRNTETGAPAGEKWLSALLYPLLDDNGKVREVICIHEDVTERKRAADEIRALNQSLEQRVIERTAKLREWEQRFTKLFQASPTPTLLTRADRVIAAANGAFLATSGYTEAEVLGSTAKDLNLYAVPHQLDEFVGSIREQGFVRAMELYLRTKDGGVRTILVSAEPLDLDGQPHVLTVGLDITERKQAEVETLNALARERELSEIKSNFVSMVSHEFRTPLGVIQSAADVLDRYLDRLEPEDRREHLDMIFRSTRGLAHLVDSVLLLGRVGDGRTQFVPAPLDLERICREVVDEVGSATAARCAVEITASPGLEGARSDPGLLRHILTNLIGNAVKYSDPGSPVQLLIERRNGDAVLTVRDRGIGIPESDRARLFNSFARGSNVGQRPGSGLGLLIVQRCVTLHGGTIHLESKTGEGTAVTVVLPVFSSPSSTNSTPS
ncbi:MAG TPA: PAS domain S-box protein [Verrucomicrobiales bacterium]|nr:PAS domain S-box protein [Verrucomicrobiales bacterium]